MPPPFDPIKGSKHPFISEDFVDYGIFVRRLVPVAQRDLFDPQRIPHEERLWR